MKQKSIKNWRREHDTHIQRFQHKIGEIEERLRDPTYQKIPQPFDPAAFNRYLIWYRGVTRTQLNPQAFTPEDILSEPNPSFDRLANIEYNKLIRDGRRTEIAPIVRFVVSLALSIFLTCTFEQSMI